LIVRDVTKRFGRFVALNNVSLSVRRGEFVCVLGPSGCGKSTLLRVIAGFEEFDSGAIIQDGRDVSQLPPSRRDFGIVFQSYALFPNLTVADNIAYGLQNQRLSRATVAARVDELLQMVELSSHRQRYPAQLSGGQQQRVAVARALALSPHMLLLDEPLSALDARVRVALRAEIVNLHRRMGVTTVMVTHDQEEALTMADRVVVMNVGEIVQVGAPIEVYRSPANPFVADFVGAMNFLPAQVDGAACTVRCGAARLHTESSTCDDLPSGAPVLLAIRPEAIYLAATDEAASNTLQARVERLEFIGASYRLRLRLLAEQCSDGQAGADFTTYLAQPDIGRRPMRVGDVVRLVLPPQHIRVYRRPADETANRWGTP
jgi:iron(III) transport system ATP-binding protein